MEKSVDKLKEQIMKNIISSIILCFVLINGALAQCDTYHKKTIDYIKENTEARYLKDLLNVIPAPK